MANEPCKSPWRSGALIVLLTLLAYAPVMHSGFIWDDDDYVTENFTLRDPSGLQRIWFELGATPQYYPLVHTTFWLEYHLWGLNASGYHVINVLLHALAVILLWRVLARLRLPGAWLAAALFALHPVAVESVAWITERKNVLSAVFYLAAALAYLRFARWGESTAPPTGPPGKFRAAKSAAPEWRWYALALLLFTGAMFSKTVACSLPAALLLVCWWKLGRMRLADVLPTLPFFAIGITLGLVTAQMEKHTVGAVGAAWDLNFSERVLIAGRALWFYATKLICPANLTFIYPRWQINTAVWWQWLFPVAAFAVVGALWLWRHRLGRGPLVAVLFFAGTLFPALGFVNVYPMRFSFVADHFQYLASVGLLALAAAGLMRIPPKAVLVLPLTLAVLVWQQVHIYHDLESLWTDTLAKNPTCWLAHNNLGSVLKNRGDLRGAETHYRTALRLNPEYADALASLGTLAFESGRWVEAVAFYQRALKSEPGHTPAILGIGSYWVMQNQPDKAIEHFQKVVQHDPGNLDALNNLGAALASKKEFAEAIKYWQLVLRIKPDSLTTRINMGKALALTGRPDEALGQLHEALRLDPDNLAALNELANLSAGRGQSDDAISHYRHMIQVSPQDALAHYNLGLMLSMTGQTDEAIEQYQLALRYQPTNAEAHNNLAVALSLKHRLAEAVTEFNEALRLQPDYAEAHNNLAFALLALSRRDEARQHLREALRLKPDYEQARQQLRELESK